MSKITQKKWFHGTTKETYKKIKKEGVLWGVVNGEPRHTFLAANLNQLIDMITDKNRPWNGDMHHFDVIFSVKYETNGIDDEWCNGWELVVKRPISIKNIKVAKYL